jgi:glycosyltransferase involved in cell wall biosynthesis
MNRAHRLLSMGHSYVVAANRRLAHEMSRAGNGDWEVTAAAPVYFHGGNDLRPNHLEPLVDEPCPLVALPAHCTSGIHVFTYGRRLRSLLSSGWDLIHCWEEPYIFAGAQVAWWLPRGMPLVYRTAQSYSKRYPPPFSWMERYALGHASGWICSGTLVAETLSTRRGYGDLPMRLIPLGVDLDAFYPDPAAGAAVRRELGWETNGSPVVGYLGRFTKEKGLESLMRVLDALATPWRALFVGEGQLESSLWQWASRYGDRVRVTTGVRHAEVPRYLNAMDILCAPSQTTAHWREQFGRMLIEAFACGVPVVGSDSGEIPHVIADAGIIVGEADEAGWCKALADLFESPSCRGEVAARGLDRARERYAWPIVARQYLDFFGEVLATRRT